MAKSPLASKKFRAFLVADITSKLILTLVAVLSFVSDKGLGLYGFLAMMTIILITGFIETAYISGQASLDRYVKVAEIAAGMGKNFISKDIKIEGPSSLTPVAPEAPKDDPEA